MRLKIDTDNLLFCGASASVRPKIKFEHGLYCAVDKGCRSSQCDPYLRSAAVRGEAMYSLLAERGFEFNSIVSTAAERVARAKKAGHDLSRRFGAKSIKAAEPYGDRRCSTVICGLYECTLSTTATNMLSAFLIPSRVVFLS